MCVSLAPARFSNTTLYAAEVDVQGKILHVLGYQNRAQNLYRATVPAKKGDWGWDPDADAAAPAGGTGNAMILPFPAVPGSMSQGNVLATKDCPRILKDMAEALRPKRRVARGGMLGADSFAVPKGVQIFEHDIYTVVLATDARLIGKVLDFVPAEKRPFMNLKIFEAYAQWYPDWPVALCCFNNHQAVEAKPLLWWYEPARQDRLFCPALDSHTGAVPDLEAEVETDHSVAVSALGMQDGTTVRYRDAVPGAVQPFIAKSVIGSQFRGTARNGDFVCRTEDVRRGKFDARRLPPPGA